MRNAALPDGRYPAFSDLRKLAKRRTPYFAYEYLDSGTGDEQGKDRNASDLQKILLTPRFMQGSYEPDTSVELFGKYYQSPFGVSPVGMSSMMWPGAEQALAKMAGEHGIPYCLSTVAAESIEVVGPLAKGNGWFQLYATQSREIRDDLLNRAKKSGFSVLVVTADVPVPSMRERQRRAGLEMPPVMNPKTIFRAAMRPKWTIETLIRGNPRFLNLEPYAESSKFSDMAVFVGGQLSNVLDWEYLKEIRAQWDGPLVLKGILSAEDAKQAVACGVDGIWVSNHGGRQFDGAPSSIEALPKIVSAVKTGKKETKVLIDSGFRTGLDIVRALRMGADFVFAGRPFIYAVCAMGNKKGANHGHTIFSADLKNNMSQLGCRSLSDIQNVEFSIKGD
ncbi:MAG: alpha-hydroxy-acid oxidizing protein [Rhizobiaceae bacterium]|nr:alpha-hydroxy-acid oxidizing protein [Rhizobiaceae bacterium]MBL4732615.1 alpha-hydroxy-acid oxidizing protein [Rhizobiaceae bacterium]